MTAPLNPLTPTELKMLQGFLLQRSAKQLTLATSHAITQIAQDVELTSASLPLNIRRSMLLAASAMKQEQSARAMRISEELAELRVKPAMPESVGLLSIQEQELRIAAQKIDSKVKEILAGSTTAPHLGYSAFADRCAVVFETPKDEVNPIGSLMLARACTSVFRGLSDDPQVLAAFKPLLVERLAPAVTDVVLQCHRELIEKGVLQNWQPRVIDRETANSTIDKMIDRPPALPNPPNPLNPPLASNPAPSAKAAEMAPQASPKPLNSEYDRLVEAQKLAANSGEKLGQASLGNMPHPPDNISWLPTLQPVVEIERDAVAFAHSVNVLPYSRDSRHSYFGNARARLAASGMARGQLAAVDVVAALFDYVVDDKRMPESAKPLFWRLQQPSLALTLLDSAYLADEPRSLRRLIENFGAIVTAFPDDVSRGTELFRRLDTVVRAVEIVASSLQTRSAVMSRQVDLEFGKAANSITQLIDRIVRERQALEQTPDRRNRRDFGRRPTRAQEKSVTEKLQKLIADRFGTNQIPDSAREFISQVWMRHLRTSVLRDGEDSQQYKVSLQVVDDLLWSLDTAKRSKTRLANRIPPLIRLLTQGMREIGAKDEEYKPFFDELFLIHLRKMQGSKAVDTSLKESLGDAFLPIAVQKPDLPDLPTLTETTDLKQATAEAPLPELPELPKSVANSPIKFPPELLRQAGLLDKPKDLKDPKANAESRTDRIARLSKDFSVASPQIPTLGESAAIPAFLTNDAQKLSNPVTSNPISSNPIKATLTPNSADALQETGDDSVKLLDVLGNLNLTDYSADLKRRPLTFTQLSDAISVGSWVETVGRDGATHFAKVAWINHRRSVVLLVRSPDRKAQSLRMTDLQARVEERRFHLLG